MAKKKKSRTQPFVIKFVLISLIVAAVSFAVGSGAIYLLRHNSYFKIRAVVIDPSLQFIDKSHLRNLLGKNIFNIDLVAVQRRLARKYPQASDLKVTKRFPNQVAVVAKERHPFAQIQVKGKVVVLDKQSTVLLLQEKSAKDLPLIISSKAYNQKLVRGLPLRGADIRVALMIAKNFKDVKSLSSYAIEKINIDNLSKIHFTLSNDLDVIIDRNKIAQRMRVLGVVLSQDQLDFKQVKYVDLRFNEPIIGKKK